jgi:adenylate cyclase
LIDIFDVQDDVTRHIVDALALNLTEGDRQRITAEHTDNLEAYDCFIRGREQFWLITKTANAQARELFQRAIGLDRKFAPPYAFVAMAHGLDYMNRWSADPAQSQELAQHNAAQAVALDDQYPYAHWALAVITLHMRRHDQAVRAAERIIALDPNFALGHEVLGSALNYSGRHAEALEHFDRAMALDPYFPDLWLHFKALAMFQLDRYDEAIGLLKRRLIRNPDTDSSRELLAACYGHLGRNEEARAEWQELFRVNPDYSLEYRRTVLPFKNSEEFEKIVDGLRKAGVVPK